MHRRNFNKTVLFSGLGMSLTDLVYAQSNKERSVIWVWLSGGASHFETFNAKPNVPDDVYKSVVGYLREEGSPIYLGGLFTNLIKHVDKLNVVANFSHKDARHQQATMYLNTGHYLNDNSVQPTSKYPSHGSITSAIHGSNQNGMPTYVAQNNIAGDGPAWLGNEFKPFDPRSKQNLKLQIPELRFNQRSSLLSQLDKSIKEKEVVDKYRAQATDAVLGNIYDGFDVDKYWDDKKEQYGNTTLGKQMYLAYRLASRGSKFVSLSTGGWDLHTNIKTGTERLVPPLDMALSGLIKDLGDNKDILVVVTSEFSRTKLNNNSPKGRDHWSQLNNLCMIGGNYESGRLIGSSDRNNYTPDSTPYSPIDLQHTIFHHLDIPLSSQRIDNSGRPRYLHEGESKNILL